MIRWVMNNRYAGKLGMDSTVTLIVSLKILDVTGQYKISLESLYLGRTMPLGLGPVYDS